jgi:DNA-binding MarR family transcriptional regulator
MARRVQSADPTSATTRTRDSADGRRAETPATIRSANGFDADPLKSYGYQTRATHRAFDRMLQRQIGKHDVSNGFWYVLRVLWGREGMSQRELANEANLTESSTVLMLDAMGRAGLVRKRRDAHDARRSNVFLTAKARRMKPKLLHYAARVNAVAAQGIAPRDLETYLRVARKMRDNLNSHVEDAS